MVKRHPKIDEHAVFIDESSLLVYGAENSYKRDQILSESFVGPGVLLVDNNRRLI